MATQQLSIGKRAREREMVTQRIRLPVTTCIAWGNWFRWQRKWHRLVTEVVFVAFHYFNRPGCHFGNPHSSPGRHGTWIGSDGCGNSCLLFSLFKDWRWCGGGWSRRFFCWGITRCALCPSEEDEEDRDNALRLLLIIKKNYDAENNDNYNILESVPLDVMV